MTLKQRDIESVIWVDTGSEIMVNYPIFTIYLYLWHATILILSAVEGLNGFKKLNIKDIDY